MGCFDTVRVKCPECGEYGDIQSKAGACVLEDFYDDSVPIAIARDIDGERVLCGCGTSFEIQAEICQFVRVHAIREQDTSSNEKRDRRRMQELLHMIPPGEWPEWAHDIGHL